MSQMAVLFVVAPSASASYESGKPFHKIDNREVFMRAIELYANREEVDQRILCVLPDDMSLIQQKYAAHLGFQGVSVAAGGPDWFGAVTRGIEKIKAHVELVMVHDACCPVVGYPLLDALENAVKKTGAAVPIINSVVALARSDKQGNLTDRLDGNSLVEVQSPQIFTRAVLEKAYAARVGLKTSPQDDAALVQAVGGKVTTVPGSRLNVRVDSDESARMAADFIKMLPKARSKAPLSPFDEAQW